MLDAAATPFVLKSDPETCEQGGPSPLWLVTKNGLRYLPTELEMDSFDEAERACDAANLRVVIAATGRPVHPRLLGSGTA